MMSFRSAAGGSALIFAITVLFGASGLFGGSSLGTATAGAGVNDGAGTGTIAIGSAPVSPAHSTDLGPGNPGQQLHLQLVLEPRDPTALASFVDAVSTPGSSDYRHYLRRGQFASMFGPTRTAISRVQRVLRQRGLEVGAASSDGLIMPLTATVGAIERGLRTSIRSFRLGSGKVVDADVSAPRVPAAIAPFVNAINGLDGFVTYHPADPTMPVERRDASLSAAAVPGQPAPCTSASNVGQYTASNLAQAYDALPLYEQNDFGAGQTIALFELAPYLSSDITTFESCYGVHTRVNYEPVDGGLTGFPNTEDSLDIEIAVALAPLATVDVFVGSNWLDNWNAIASDDNAQVVSVSWGGCEVPSDSGLSPILSMLATQGQSVFAAAGDAGSEDCTKGQLGLDDPGSQPDITDVGGTYLNGVGDPPFAPPNETASTFGGGGISSVWTMPYYQPFDASTINRYSTGSYCHASSGNYCREAPDISSNFYNYDIYTNGKWGAIGGTSESAPTAAAMTALINASSAGCRSDPVGFLNPALYLFAPITPGDFNDITTGNNDDGDPIDGGLYPATTGYDMATGIGSLETANLADTLCGGQTAIVAAQGPDQSMDSYWQENSTSTWNAVSVAGTGSTYSAPSVVAYGTSANIAAQGPGHTLDLYWSSTSGRSWNAELVAGSDTTYSAPAVSNDGVTAYVAAVAANHSLVVYSAPDGSSTWTPITVGAPGAAFSTPALSQSGDLLFATVEGARHSLQSYWSQIGSTTWNHVVVAGDGTTFSAPALADYGESPTVVAQGSGHSLDFYTSSTNGATWDPELVAGSNTTYSSPTITNNGQSVDISVRGAGNSLVSYLQADGSSTWTAHTLQGSGTTYSAPSVVFYGKGSGNLVAQGSDQSLKFFWTATSGSTWNPESVAGSNTTYSQSTVSNSQ